MNNSTIGVISTPDGRSKRDLELQQAFSCKRPNQNIPNVAADSLGVLGFAMEERSGRDKQMLSNFSCSSRENYSPEMIYPRSVRDMQMLHDFNPGACQENFQFQGNHYGQRAKIARREDYCGSSNPSPIAQLNFNPYNSSSSIKYVPLQ